MAKNLKQSLQANKSNTAIPKNAASGVDEKTVEHYGKMNENQLMSEMRKIAADGKANGTLNAEELENFYNKTAPMLNGEQRKKLRMLINSLK